MQDFLAVLERWCRLKLGIVQKNHDDLVFKQGEVWWCSIGANIGEEAYGKGSTFTRPVLILRKLTHNSFVGLPLTGQDKQGSWYVHITLHEKPRCVMLNQVRIFDKKRLVIRMGTIEEHELAKVKKAFANFYGS